MKNRNYLKLIVLSGLLFITTVSCEREYSDDVAFATFPATGEVFTDAPVGMGSDFYFPYSGSKPTAWTVDKETSYKSTASMRFDVPNANDPEGNYAGAIFRIDGEGSGRDLSGYDALTFWAKASQAVTIGEVGFGEDFGENKYVTTRTNIDLTTNWIKYIIPIPDPSKLIQERGMLRYSAGGIGAVGSEVGYTFWIDEVKFEKLGTIAQPKPAIFGGENLSVSAFVGGVIKIDGLTQTMNLGNGNNLTVNTSPSYFTFNSTDIEVARVDQLGMVTIVGEGTATITATLGGVRATGSGTISVGESISPAPTPSKAAADVISLYSDAYTDVAVDFFNGFYDGSTTKTSTITSGTDNFLFYTDLNYVGIEFQNPTINATTMTHLHLDIYTDDTTSADFFIKIRDRGANGELNTNVFTGGPIEDDKEISYTVLANQITPGQWISINIPLTGDITTQKDNLAQIVFVGDIDFLLDNLYFSK